MRTFQQISVVLVALIVMVTSQFANAQILVNEDAPQGAQVAKTDVFVPVDNARLFSVPTADVIRNMDICAEGGGFLSTNENSSLIGNIGFGLGDVAQINVSADEILSTVTGRRKSVAVAAFKLRALPEGQYWPAVAAILNRSFETSYNGFSMNEVNITTIATKHFWNERISFNLGTKVTISTLRPDSTLLHAEKANLLSYHPMVGLKIRANPQTFVLLEVETTPTYNTDELTGYTLLQDAAVKHTYLGGLGVRYYFTSWLSLDTGARVDVGDEPEVTLKGKMNVAIPVRTMLKRLGNSFTK